MQLQSILDFVEAQLEVLEARRALINSNLGLHFYDTEQYHYWTRERCENFGGVVALTKVKDHLVTLIAQEAK